MPAYSLPITRRRPRWVSSAAPWVENFVRVMHAVVLEETPAGAMATTGGNQSSRQNQFFRALVAHN
jgi:hypothetical protein